MPKNLKTPAQIAATETELHNQRVAAGVVNRLWVSLNGHVTCDEHAGLYLKSDIAKKPRAMKHETLMDSWTAEIVRFDSRDAYNEDLYCDTCKAGLFPVYAKHVVPVVAEPAPAKVAAPKKAEAPKVETEVEAPAPAPAAKKFYVWKSEDKTVCAKHTGPILKKAIEAAPRKRKHELSNGTWAKVVETSETVCTRCLSMAKKAHAPKAETKKLAKKASEPKKLVKKSAKGTEQFYTVRFSDGYYLATYSASEMTFTSSFREARRFKTYDGAEKIITRMQDEYDAEDLTPIISVVRVTIDHDFPAKTRTQRMGVLSF